MKKWLFIAFCCLGISFLNAQSGQQGIKKSLEAMRIQVPIQIDGELDEAVWSKAQIATDFTQREPNVGQPASKRTEVRILYDNTAIYVGATLYDVSGDSILRDLSLRDSWQNTDWFEVNFDPYKKNTDGVGFWVTAAGVQGDSKYFTNNEDGNWNAVWDSEVQIFDKGWKVEMRIPYSAIRFSDTPEQEWGLNFIRESRRIRERSFWNEVNPEVDGYLTQFGTLKGIKDIQAPLRLSAVPYVSALTEVYSDGSSPVYGVNGGMDLKYGINEAFTIDMTLIPDFNQVQSDNQVLNLSPFEVQFNEQRQFFTEGIELFEKANLFYSRRIGGRPVAYWNAWDDLGENEYLEEHPDKEKLLNATKLSGRTKSGLGIGVFNGVTKETLAVVRDSVADATRTVMTSPLTNYNLAVLDQALPNNSSVTFTNASVLRRGSFYDSNVSALNFDLKNKKQSYAIAGGGRLSQHYDPELTKPELGSHINARFSKISGRLRFNYRYNQQDEKYNPNDLGFNTFNNFSDHSFNVNYQHYTPFGKFLRAGGNLWFGYFNRYKPYGFRNFIVNPNAWFTTKKFFAFGVWSNFRPIGSHDYFEPRVDGWYFKNTPDYRGGIWISTDYRKKFALDVFTNIMNNQEKGRRGYGFEIGPRYRVNDKFFVQYELEHWTRFNDPGYVDNWTEDEEDVIVFGRRDVSTTVNSISSNYIFNNKMGITFRLRHYWSTVEYKADYYRLQRDGSLNDFEYDGTDEKGNSYFNNSFNAFTIDMQYSWQFAPGSEMRVVWKNSIFDSQSDVDLNYLENWNVMTDALQTNNLSIKILYYLDYLKVKKWVSKEK